MRIFTNISELSSFLTTRYNPYKKLGFVPTMGALHEGHMSLLEACRQENELVICSIYVNPIQFNNADDFDEYPRNLDNDSELLSSKGCDILFAPDDKYMYPAKNTINFDVGYFDEIMEGINRPGHFKGVALVVAKLFNIVKPDAAYFGLKDLQQFTLLKKMVSDLTYPIQMKGLPIVREQDGLAMSSRNQRLSYEDRRKAPAIYKSLQLAADNLKQSMSVKEAKLVVQNFCSEIDGLTLEYFEVAKASDLKLFKDAITQGQQYALCIAAWLGGIRLIDNIIIEI
jgi:pantoate--beta-alanine ligase